MVDILIKKKPRNQFLEKSCEFLKKKTKNLILSKRIILDSGTTILRLVYRTFDLSATSASIKNNSCFARSRLNKGYTLVHF